MSIEESELVDAVVIDAAAGTCCLVIVDHLPWDRAHLHLLQTKLNHYLRFVESGEIFVRHPGAADCDVLFEVEAIHAPTREAAAFFTEARVLLEAAGFGLAVVPLGSAYADAAG